MKKEESFLTNISKLYVLNSLSKSPKHGYELIGQFNSITGNKLSAGQIYPLLTKMHNNGLLSYIEEYEGDRKRKIYSITEKGQELRDNIMSKLKKLLS